MDIRALLFDVNGTLIDIETDEWMEECYRAIAHFLTYQGIYLRRGQLRDLYFQVMKQQFAASEEVYPEFNVVEVWREVLRRNATSFTLSLPTQKLHEMPRMIAEMQRGISRKRLMPFPQVPEILAALQSRYPLAIVSDAQTVYGVPELCAAGLFEYFSPIVISGDYGFRKPDPRLYQAALTALNVRPEQAIFIGNDRFRDMWGARQLGMKTILFCPNGDAGGTPDTEPDYLLYRYADLPRALEFFATQH
jgi:putative hydrolase of the HAD superfamily